MKVLRYAAGVFVILHGIAHLVGFTSLRNAAESTYALAGGRWVVGPTGMQVLALLWLLSFVGFLASVVGWLARRAWWPALMLMTIALSTVMIALDWAKAFRGGVVNAGILLVMALVYLIRRRNGVHQTASLGK